MPAPIPPERGQVVELELIRAATAAPPKPMIGAQPRAFSFAARRFLRWRKKLKIKKSARTRK
jgi:hypothetical protein